MKLQSLALVALAALSLLALSACNDDDKHPDPGIVYIQDGVLYNTPPGGEDFGDAYLFDTFSAEHSISDFDDADGYDFVLDSTALVMISVESYGTLNPLVELYDPAGAFVAGDDDGGVGSDALLVGVLNPGLYTAVVWASDAGAVTSGDYKITILIGDANGGDFEEVIIGTSMTFSNRTLVSDDGSATWAFTLLDPSSVTIDVTQTFGAADVALQIIDQRGNEIAFIDPPGIADPDYISQNLPRGTYFAVVLNAPLAPAGTYDINISVAAQGTN